MMFVSQASAVLTLVLLKTVQQDMLTFLVFSAWNVDAKTGHEVLAHMQ